MTIANANPAGVPETIRELHDWLLDVALGEFESHAVFDTLCTRLLDCGMALLRAHIALRAVHPLVRSVDLTWWRDASLEEVQRQHGGEQSSSWLNSPLHWMLEQRLFDYRQQLTAEDAERWFPIFDELVARGATDYLAALIPFGESSRAVEREDGIMISWATDACRGFSAEQTLSLRYLHKPIALLAKIAKRERTAHNVLNAYLGPDAAERVLDGQIRLGDVVKIPAVVWFSDLRDSSRLAERLPVSEFLHDLNLSFGCSAGAVLQSGGEVLRFIGDAVLAVFPIDEHRPLSATAEVAAGAARDALARLAALNADRREAQLEPLAFGIGLHVGDVLYGNIGVPSRIEFSVVGSAANEVSRLQGLSKTVGEPVIVSKRLADALQSPCRSLGEFSLEGLCARQEIFTLSS